MAPHGMSSRNCKLAFSVASYPAHTWSKRTAARATRALNIVFTASFESFVSACVLFWSLEDWVSTQVRGLAVIATM